MTDKKITKTSKAPKKTKVVEPEVIEQSAFSLDDDHKEKQEAKKTFVETVKDFLSEIKSFMFADKVTDAKYTLKIDKEIGKQVRPGIRFAFYSIAAFFGFFFLWSILAPLDKAATAGGVIALNGKPKTIQHLYGGVITDIEVAEGDFVAEGDVLIRLNDAEIRASLQESRAQLITARASEIRLLAERNGSKLEKLEFPDEIFDESIPEVKEMIYTQSNLYELHKRLKQGKIDTLNQRIAQLNEKIKGYEIQANSLKNQVEINKKDWERYEELVSKGLAREVELSEKRSRYESLVGSEAEVRANIASTREQIAEFNFEIISTEVEFQNKVDEELKEVQTRVSALKERVISDQDKLDRSVVRSPYDGAINDLQVHTVGGVLQPGGKILEIIPQDDLLIVEAKINPKDIESVYPGLDAKVQLAAFKTRLVPRISGKVIYVGANVVQNPNPGAGADPNNPASYYVARVQLDEEEMERVNHEIILQPGMPASVFIVKGTRTLAQYLLSPLIESFHKAFKES